MRRAIAIAIVAALVGAAAAVTCDTKDADFDHPGEHTFKGGVVVNSTQGIAIEPSPACDGLSPQNDCHILANVGGLCVEWALTVNATCTTAGVAGQCRSDNECRVTKTVFASSTLTGGIIGNSTVRDATCQSLADAAALLGTYFFYGPFDSGSTTVVVAPEAASLSPAPVHYQLPSGATVLDESAAAGILTASALDGAINEDETGATISVDTAVWVGALTGIDCTDFSSLSGSGRTGDATVATDSWRNAGSQSCGLLARIYCVQGT